jgi:hypothetical protein
MGEGHDAVHATELSLHQAPDPGLILLRGGNYNDAESIECAFTDAGYPAARGIGRGRRFDMFRSPPNQL